MDLSELQSVQAKERQSSSLQHLRGSFYEDAGRFVEELRERRDGLASEADDPFGSEEIRRLSDDVNTARSTVESLYERRVGKVVKKASIAAAGMPCDIDGMTVEEERLFERLVEAIEESRGQVLGRLEAERAPHAASGEEADPRPPGSDLSEGSDREGADGDSQGEPAGVGAASAMGSGGDTGDGMASTPADTAGDVEAEPVTVERQTVRITADVGDIFGVDGRTYDLSTDDVVDLPEENAEILVGDQHAEPLE